MTRSYEAQTKAIWNTDQTLPSCWPFGFLHCSSQTCCYFGGYFPHSPCCQSCTCPTALGAARLSPGPAEHHSVCCEGLQGLPVFQAQMLHQQPPPLRPRTSLEFKACACRSVCRAGWFRKLVALQPPASAGSRQERGGKGLSGADSETEPAGAGWESAGSGTAEKDREAEPGGLRHPREPHCLLLPGRGHLPASGAWGAQGFAVPSQGLGALSGQASLFFTLRNRSEDP